MNTNGFITSQTRQLLLHVLLLPAVRRYFIFQVFATFIYQFLVGSALSNIQGIINGGINTIVPLLGVSAAQTSTFFMTYIMINVRVLGQESSASR